MDLPPQAEDLRGRAFGRLTPVEYRGRHKGSTYWFCSCECGGTLVVMAKNLKAGETRSCGCWLREAPSLTRKDRVGRRYGNLTVLELVAGAPVTTWTCRCDCGARLDLRPRELARRVGCGRGCALPRKSKYAFSQAERWRRQLYSHHRVQARVRDITHSLPLEAFLALIDRNCAYCGAPPSNTYAGNAYQGVDRIDSALGYEVGNVTPCCARCNRAKGTASVAGMVAWAKKLIANLGE